MTSGHVVCSFQTSLHLKNVDIMKVFSLLCLALVATAAFALPRPDESDGDAPPPTETEENVTPAPPTDEGDDEIDVDDNNNNSNDDVDDDDNNDEDDDNDNDDNNIVIENRSGEVVYPNGNSSENFRNETENDAPPEESGEALDFDALESLVYEFTNSTTGINTADLVKRLNGVEKSIRITLRKLGSELRKDEAKISRLSFLNDQVNNLGRKLGQLDYDIESLVQGARRLNGDSLTYDSSYGGSSFGRHNSWATLYRSRGHSGRSTELDFRLCGRFDTCCKNLQDLDNDSQSIHTHDTCVKMFREKNCLGQSVEFYPGSPNNHQDFGSDNDSYSSGQPCSRN